MKPLTLILLAILLLSPVHPTAYAQGDTTALCQPLTLPDSPSTPADPADVAATLQTPLSQLPDAPLLREAIFLLGEGDRLSAEDNLVQAREKWLASAELYSQTNDKLAEASAYLRLGNSYVYDLFSWLELALNPARLHEVTDYYHRASLLSAEVYETVIRKDFTFDETVLEEAERLYQRGFSAFEAGDCATATPLLREARTLYAGQAFQSGELRVLILQMRCAVAREDMLSAFTRLLEALAIVSTMPVGDSIAEQYLEGVDQLEQGDLQNAKLNLSEVRAAYLAQGIEQNTNDYANATHNLANVYAAEGDFVEAEKLYREALPLFIEADDEYTAANRATTHHNLGNLGVVTGRYAMAIEQYTLARAQWQAIGDPVQELHAMSGLSLAMMEQGDYSGAVALLEAAQAQYSRLPLEAEFEGDLLNNIGRAYFGQGRYAEALDLFERSFALRQQLPNPTKQVESLNNIASVRLNAGETEAALAAYDEVLRFAAENELPQLADRTRVNQAAVFVRRGDYQQALANLVAVQPRFIERGELTYATTISTTIGTTYLAIGDETNAQQYLLSGMQSADQFGTLELSAATRDLLGSIAQSDDCLAQAETIFAHVGNRVARASTLNNRALLAMRAGAFDEALPLVEEAHTIALETGNQLLAAETGLLLGGVYLADQRVEQSRALLTETYQTALAQGDLRTAAAAQALLSLAATQLGDWESADQHIATALEHVEQLQTGLTVGALKTFFFDDFADIYVWAAQVAAVRDDLETSFYRLEQARARALLDQFDDVAVTGDSEELTQLRIRLDALREQRNTLLATPVRDAVTLQLLETQIAEQETTYTTLQAQVAAQDATPAPLSTAVASVADVQAMLDSDTTLVSYFMSPQAGFVAAFVISADAFTVQPIEATPAQIITEIEAFRTGFYAPNLQSADAHPDPLRQLYTWLITPLQDVIVTEKLLIVPHADLHYLPFAALTDGETYLSDQYIHSNLPSASSLRFLSHADGVPQSALVVGNPRTVGLPSLQYAEQEAAAVAELFDATLLTGGEATEASVITNTTQDIWHIAAHGRYNPTNPLFSTLYLADGERLDVHEIYRLDLQTQLVVLSACETQVGTASRGDEVVALNRAFLQAGAPTVLATLWQVDDAATAQLITAFYDYLKADNGAAQALQFAQRDLRAEYAHPYYWAGFVLTGDMGKIVEPLPVVEPSPEPSTTQQSPIVQQSPTVHQSPTIQPETQTGVGICGAALLPVVLLLPTVRYRRRKNKTEGE